jgi:lipoate-protein ligase A
MALDEAISGEVLNSSAPPTLRFYEWEIPSVSLGCFQRTADVNLDYCGEAGIPVVRRPTGGRGILHDVEITYSFSSTDSREEFSGGLFESYGALSRAFYEAFLSLGLSAEINSERKSGLERSPLCFRSTSYGEITVGGKKVIGSAQKRWSGGFLQQGSIPLVINRLMTKKVFGVDDFSSDIAGLGEVIPSLNTDDIKQKIRDAFENIFQVRLVSASPSPQEAERAEDLLREKYLLPEWNRRR